MDNSEIIGIGRDVVKKEITALETLSAAFPYAFAEAVQYMLHDLRGKVVVTAMGKPGYVARRFAATLCSTGIKAAYLHPAEASHGDMGVISDEDCVVVMSYSGETKETFDVVDYTRRFGVKLIAICSNPRSTLGKNADINVTIPEVAEACTIGKAPTVSVILLSTMANAFIYALEHESGLTPDKYLNWHPHGALGASLLKVSAIMHTGGEVPLLPESAGMREVFEAMGRKVRFGCVGALDKDGRLAGIFTDGDIRRRLADGMDVMGKRLGDVMGRAPKTISPDTLAAAATLAMNEKKIQVFFVVDADDRPVGILGFHDLLKAGVA
jgi:arabinose-5-phosphate isomerase